MKKFFSILMACCTTVVMAIAQDGSSCIDAVHVEYGADITLSGDTYWIKLRVQDFNEKGLSAFWYSTDSLFLEGFMMTGNPGWGTAKCTSFGLTMASAPNAKITFDYGALMSAVESQLAKQEQLTQEEKNMILGQMVYMSLTPKSKQTGRFIINEFGLAAGSDCANPWDVALGAYYGLTEQPNVFRLDPAIVGDSLHIVYEPLRASSTDMTAMKVQIRIGDCENGAIVQDAASVANGGEGIVILDQAVVNQAIEAKQPLYVTVNRGNDFANVIFRNVHVGTREEKQTLCAGDTLNLYGRQFTEAGVYEFDIKNLVPDGVLYAHVTLTIEIKNDCVDAIDMVDVANVVVRPTAARVGQDIEIVADGKNTVDVFDLTGKRVQSAEFINSTSIRINRAGEYFLRISGNANKTRKVVVL